jgi:SCY1-like protein 2
MVGYPYSAVKQLNFNADYIPDILPILLLAIESPTHAVVDASLRSLPVVLPVLDFSTIKNELFPVIASVFTKTTSLGIKVRGLEAFVILCGGSLDLASNNDGLDGIANNAIKKSSSSALDKYTMQEKIVPLIKSIKTKEPAVSMAAMNVLRQVGTVADEEFVALHILPILWTMSLGPLLDLKQFQAFMELIKKLSSQVEADRTKKLSELAGTNGSRTRGNDDFMSFGAAGAFQSNGGSDNAEVDFETLVKGNAIGGATINPMDSGWDSTPAKAAAQVPQNTSNKPQPATFSWSTPSSTGPAFSGNSGSSMGALKPQQAPAPRTITPDLSRFDALTPTTTQFSQPLQPTPLQQTSSSPPPLQPQSSYNAPLQPLTNYKTLAFQPPPQTQTLQSLQSLQSQPTSIDWGAAATASPWANSNAPASNTSLASLGNSMSSLSMNQSRPAMPSQPSSFSLPPPPGPPTSSFGAPPPSAFGMPGPAKPASQQKSGLDAYESLL